MKIVFINAVGFIGGAELNLLDQIAALRGTHNEPHLLITLGKGALNEEAAKLGLPVECVPLPAVLAGLGENWAQGKARARLSFVMRSVMSLLYLPFLLLRLRRRLSELSPDIIQSNGIKAHLLAAAVKPASAQLIWYMQDFVAARKISPHLLRLLRRRADQVLAISQAVADDARELFPDCGISLIYPGIDLQVFSPKLEPTPEALDAAAGLTGVPHDVLRIVLVGTFARWKGHDLFLRAAKKLLDDPEIGAPLRFYVVGGAVYHTTGSQYSLFELQTMAASLGISGQVGFTGFISDTAAVFRSVDIFVHASSQPEPFGRTIIEAMACGSAVVAADAGGVPEIITSGRNGLLFRRNDSTSLAAQIKRLVTDAELRKHLGSAAQRSASERFSRVRLASEILALYERTRSYRPV